MYYENSRIIAIRGLHSLKSTGPVYGHIRKIIEKWQENHLYFQRDKMGNILHALQEKMTLYL